ncbi:MAG: molecular chaperone [Adlercreutzia equolifaciens]|uniref:TorD/DmsD family molecular chaperone n=1 Tax=Adlercreutzia equolifaciens TaxID=446660 RepID=UPI001CC65170|nr:molecular chaperone TorD family protein [Adlercreutzia equolifaciens]
MPFADASQEVREAADHLRLWRRSVQERPEEVIDDLKTAWFRSLVGPARPLAAPWESYYLDENNRLFTDSTREVRAAFRAHGLEFEKKNREPDDHIGLMLSFLAVLAGREAEAVEAGDEETARSLQKDQADFIDNHVLTFVDEWAAAMAEKSDSDFYAGMALLACGLVKERRAQLEEKLSGSEDAGATSGADGECCKEAVSCAC